MDWDVWMPAGDFGAALQARKTELIPYIKEISSLKRMVDWRKFTKTLMDSLNLESNVPSARSRREDIRWGIKHCILIPLERFGVVSISYGKEDSFGIRPIKGFHITPMGKVFLEDLARIGGEKGQSHFY